MFIDEATIFIKAGGGGNGAISFRREKFVPFGGPDGGDGGKGADIIGIGSSQYNTLLYYRYHRHFKSKPGAKGSGARRTGKSGKDKLLYFPIGTILTDPEDEDFLIEFIEDGERKIIGKGGKGGAGNYHYKSSINQAPRKATEGKPGEERELKVTLKLMADVGLFGLPNAGKSTLLSTISSAKPKIGSYPFTTLEPKLGVVQYYNFLSYVVADIPGIIEGAHTGKGLGDRFLRHIERTKIILHLIDSNLVNIKENYLKLENELKSYDENLWKKKRLVVLTKSDLKYNESEIDEFIEYLNYNIIDYIEISSVTGYNIKKLVDKIGKDYLFLGSD